MARFTVEDCLRGIDNRFNMTLAAALRARKIEKGSEVLLDNEENDKPTVLALREIADQKVDGSILNTID
ncbi:MAG: DNA-directed polymerase subunit omega [Burkholderiales bacterium]|jgi:DNA-directed RNA polymerase subunit omega|nr:DNA-directed polymerase subunit omega [Burkholderiales bacterium]